MNLKESIKKELLAKYEAKNTTIEERFKKHFSDLDLTKELSESDVKKLGNFILLEVYNQEGEINEGLFSGITSFIGGLFGNLGGNVTEQLKEWLVGWVLDKTVGKIFNATTVNAETGEVTYTPFYNMFRSTVKNTLAELSFGELIEVATDCDKLTKHLTLGFTEAMLEEMLGKLNLDGVIVDNIRQELDKTFIENSTFINKLAGSISKYVCGATESIRNSVNNFSSSYGMAT